MRINPVEHDRRLWPVAGTATAATASASAREPDLYLPPAPAPGASFPPGDAPASGDPKEFSPQARLRYTCREPPDGHALWGELMFDNVSDKLQRVFKNLCGEGKLSEANMEAALREIRVALLEADVHFRVVKQFIEAVKEKAMGQEVLTALSPTQQVIKIVKDEMVKMLGQHQARLRMATEPPSVFLITGLQGSGKTTSTAKLARWLSKNGSSPMMVSVDVYGPAARKHQRFSRKPAQSCLAAGGKLFDLADPKSSGARQACAGSIRGVQRHRVDHSSSMIVAKGGCRIDVCGARGRDSGGYYGHRQDH